MTHNRFFKPALLADVGGDVGGRWTLVCGRCCLFGHHSGHPREPASEAYSRCRDDMLGSKDKLAQLAQKVSSCESRMKAERDRVAKERSAMKKSLRHGIKGLRDLLNQKQNELMEMVRLEEETRDKKKRPGTKQKK